MHELAITERILQIALDHLPPQDDLRISDVYLVIGDLSSIVDDSVQFYWNIISQNTAASGATLHFQRQAAQLTCQTCHHTYHPADDDWACPACHGLRVRVVAGEAFYVDAIDVCQTANPPVGHSQPTAD